jgi:hypothetical protein
VRIVKNHASLKRGKRVLKLPMANARERVPVTAKVRGKAHETARARRKVHVTAKVKRRGLVTGKERSRECAMARERKPKRRETEKGAAPKRAENE